MKINRSDRQRSITVCYTVLCNFEIVFVPVSPENIRKSNLFFMLSGSIVRDD